MKQLKQLLVMMVAVLVSVSIGIAAERAKSLKVDEAANQFIKENSDGLTFAFKTEKGAEYEVYVVDGYNNNKNKHIDGKLSLENPIKAVWFQLLMADNKTAYPKAVYKEYNKSKSRGDGGYTPEKVGPAAVFKAEDTKTHFFIWGSKVAYSGYFAVLVKKK